MIRLLALVLLLTSTSLFAQSFPGDFGDISEYMQKIMDAHDKSPGVIKLHKETEEKYQVKCQEEGSFIAAPGFSNRVTYAADCKGENQKFRMKIVSKYKEDDKGDFSFKVKKFVLKFK